MRRLCDAQGFLASRCAESIDAGKWVEFSSTITTEAADQTAEAVLQLLGGL
jgi:hypothetical protein